MRGVLIGAPREAGDSTTETSARCCTGPGARPAPKIESLYATFRNPPEYKTDLQLKNIKTRFGRILPYDTRLLTAHRAPVAGGLVEQPWGPPLTNPIR